MTNIIYLPKEEAKTIDKIVFLLSKEFPNLNFQSSLGVEGYNKFLICAICKEDITRELESQMTTFSRGAYFALVMKSKLSKKGK